MKKATRNRNMRSSSQTAFPLYGLIIVCLIFIGLLLLLRRSPSIIKKPPARPPSKFLETSGTQLRLLGKPYTFTGINAYNIAGKKGRTAGCGGYIDNPDELFAAIRPNSIVRFWGWQGAMVTNMKTKQPDWSGIDRVLQSAKKHNQRVIISLGDQAGTCDDGIWKNKEWYESGYKEVNNTSGLTPLSYWEFVQLFVSRYKNSQTIAMWELINEPETADCVDGYTGRQCYGHQRCTDHAAAAKSLRNFFDTVGGRIKEIDPNHLIESGVIGGGQCGADNEYYSYLHESPAIDVASYHDYNAPDKEMPGDQWNGLAMRLKQMKKIGKPLIIGEAGILAQDNTSECISFTQRKDKLAAKMKAQFEAGIVGYLPWNWSSDNAGVCNFDIPPEDPLMKVLRDGVPVQ